MKKSLKILETILFASFLFTSCGGNFIASNGKKVAELQCKSTKLMQQAATGDASVMGESTKLAAEAVSFSKEM